MAAPGEKFRVVTDDLQTFVGTLGPLLLVITRRAPTLASMEAFRDAMRRHSASYPEQSLLLVILRAPRPRLTQGVRSMLLDIWAEFGGRSAVAMWVGRQSFAGALQRSFITAVSMIRVRKTPFTLVASAAEAGDWFAALDPKYAAHRDGWVTAIDDVMARELADDAT